MDDAVPGVSCVVDEDVDLAVAEVSGALDKSLDVVGAEDVACYGNCLAAGLVDAVGDIAGLLCDV